MDCFFGYKGRHLHFTGGFRRVKDSWMSEFSISLCQILYHLSFRISEMFVPYPAFGIKLARVQGMTSHLSCLEVEAATSKHESQATI